MSTLLIVILILLLFGVLPIYPYSATWGVWPGGMVGVLLIVLVVLLLTGRLG